MNHAELDKGILQFQAFGSPMLNCFQLVPKIALLFNFVSKYSFLLSSESFHNPPFA